MSTFNDRKHDKIQRIGNYTSEEVNNDLKRVMATFADKGEPKVGIFWYLPDENDLFGVTSVNLRDGRKSKYGITCGKLHKDYWSKEYHRAKNKKKLDSIFFTDFTKIPRGRIFYNEKNNTFDVYVGSWYKDYESDLENLLKDEFDLPSLRFIQSEHWELGHGWSEHEL